MVALDLLGRRSTLRILWELREGQPLTFRALQDAAQTNPSLLNTRLRELRENGLLATRKEGLNVHYRIADPRALQLMQSLESVFCPPEGET